MHTEPCTCTQSLAHAHRALHTEPCMSVRELVCLLNTCPCVCVCVCVCTCVCACPLQDPRSQRTMYYICVKTSNMPGAATDARVSCELRGEAGATPRTQLKNTSAVNFRAGQVRQCARTHTHTHTAAIQTTSRRHPAIHLLTTCMVEAGKPFRVCVCVCVCVCVRALVCVCVCRRTSSSSPIVHWAVYVSW